MRGLGIGLIALAFLSGCSTSQWLNGRWAQLAEDGKLIGCIEFKGDGTYVTYLERGCEGQSEELLSGQWQLKKNQLAMKTRNPLAPPAALAIVKRSPTEFVLSGASGAAGEYYRAENPIAVAALEQRLIGEGKIKIRELPPEMGCVPLGKSLDDLKKLPKDTTPRLLRKADAQLLLAAEIPPAGGEFAKITYAADNDRVVWIAWELAEIAMNNDALRTRLEGKLGTPAKQIAIGEGEQGQKITCWKTFCRNVRGMPTVDIDLTLFATPAQKKGTLYLSDGSVGKLWATFEELAKEANK
ncbi:MAG: hypothetical protein HY906_16160 [Deltaproteobacteria bacterium]|nr:hypothetical protein [Deltaproteobacteria bacterium]